MKKFLFLILILSFSCKQEQEEQKLKVETPVLNQVVVITNNAPGRYPHLVKQDSLGKVVKDSIGPKLFFPDYGFSYLDDQNNVMTWTPKTGESDTLVISTFTEFLELSSHNPFTSIKETFLVKKGDTVVLNYEDRLPVADIINRDVSQIELNYNRYRHKELFKNKYTPHQLVIFHMFLEEKYDREKFKLNTINNYLRSKEAYLQEIKFLDSLLNSSQISEIAHQYRLNALEVVMQNHKNNRTIKEWLSSKAEKNERFEVSPEFNLANTDSLMKFSFFRNYLKNISKYDLSLIEENNGTSGSFYIDSRTRFDSILEDDRFNQTAKNFLLFEAYDEIGENFKVKDKEKYFKKLEAATTDPY